jgi:hypothetical protein
MGFLLIAVAAACSMGAIAFPGKHSGTVIYDRWDGCIFYSGVKVDYITDKDKEQLRKYSGQNVEIDVKELSQPVNPGDALFSKFVYVGAAPAPTNKLEEKVAKALRVQTALGAKDGEMPVLNAVIVNDGKEDFQCERLTLAPTVLTKFTKPERWLCPADGPSFAAMTREEVRLGDWSTAGRPDRMVVKGYFWSTEGVQNGVPGKMRVRDDARLHEALTIKAHEKLAVAIEIEVPAGEYDFLCGLSAVSGFNGATTSNLTAFDVDEGGKVKRVEVKGR